MDAFLSKLRTEGRFIDGELQIKQVSRDPDDDYLLALCKAAQAHVLLTGDKDLLVLEKYGRTRIMNAKAFIVEHLKKE